MLAHLARYARATGLCAQPGLARRKISWAVDLSGSGVFFQLRDLRVSGQGTPVEGCPDLTTSELARAPKDQPRCRFLVETAALLLGDPQELKVEQQVRKRAFATNLYRRAASELPTLAWLGACAGFLMSETERARAWQALAAARGAPRDLVVLLVDGRNPLECLDWREWWVGVRAALAGPPADGTALSRDFLTGELAVPVATHPKIMGLVASGGLSSGDSLISFDKPAFQSYGLLQSANAAMSSESASLYAGALNHLMERSTPLGGTRICHWNASGHEPGPFTDFLVPSTATSDGRDEPSCVLVVSGSSGRVRVRDWHCGSPDFRQARDAWFRDLELVRPDGGALDSPPVFEDLVRCLGRTPVADPPAGTVCQLVRCALDGCSPSREILARVLAHLRGAFLNSEGWDPPAAPYALLALHQRRAQGRISSHLDGEQPAAAYHCGRLFATLVWIQAAALQRDLGRYSLRREYALASTRPAHAFPSLLAGGHRGLRKIVPGLRRLYQSDIKEIAIRLKGGLPEALTLESQGLFALGYYHQVAHNRDLLAQRRSRREVVEHPPENEELPWA